MFQAFGFVLRVLCGLNIQDNVQRREVNVQIIEGRVYTEIPKSNYGLQEGL